MRVAGVDVNTEDTRAGRTDVLGVRRILQRKQAEIALPTVLVKIVRSVADSKQITIFRIPLQVCDLQSLRFVIEALLQEVRVNISKGPQGQQGSLPVLVLISRIFIEPVVPSKFSKSVEVELEKNQNLRWADRLEKNHHSLNYLGRDQQLVILQILARDDGGRDQGLNTFHGLKKKYFVLTKFDKKICLF